MNPMRGLLKTRLSRQGLAPTRRDAPEGVVAWLGAVQAQDYLGAAWALALRLGTLTLADVDQALAEGRIVRTHVLRPTWHLVAPRDLRWMQALTGPRIKARLTTYDARMGLDARLYARARTIMARALEGRRSLSRAELAAALKRRGIEAAGQRLAHLVMDAEIAAVICSGPRRGREHTYALVDEHVPATRALSRDEALGTLAMRYFQSHGPATLHDFVWWSGLSMADARAAVALADVKAEMLAAPPTADRVAGAHYLLPNYDEFLIAYRHRGASLDPARSRNFGVFSGTEYPHQIVLHGRIAGSWRREVGARDACITLKPYATPSAAETAALARAAARFGRFVGLPCGVRHSR